MCVCVCVCVCARLQIIARNVVLVCSFNEKEEEEKEEEEESFDDDPKIKPFDPNRPTSIRADSPNILLFF